ncbi:G-type lectin S-receptor-like serine/threonine-protein kinase LECRK1 [Prosopis cineraria]|uniref:G-type lectin S-receptor-like serine/threonine-protein kinase LECRK1 n=1 Tax=Prosopis cineraria TaxID=364024 RepID=UPI00240F55E4|nr:G-type lectin S-receptor-like serine/threonine-protein kinase LECRK1 [Prosopis cineraria]
MYIHMASMTLFLFAVLFANQVTAQQNHSTVIRLGSSISPRNSTWWVSASGLFTFGFYPKGNGFAVGIWLKGEPQNTIVWTANRDDPPVSSDSIIKLTKDGLVLLRSKKDDVNLNALLELATSASMLDSGNFVLYNGSHSVIWQSFDFPTHTILGGQSFSNDFNPLVSALSNSDHSSGYFSLSQSDDELGNLFAYPLNRSTETDSSADAYVYWSTHLPNDFAYYPTLSFECYRIFEMGGGENVSSIYVLANGTYLGKSTTSVYRATLDVDGNFRTYVHQFENNTRPTIQVMWEALSDQCEVNGFCGFNSYCSTTETDLYVSVILGSSSSKVVVTCS